MNTSKKMNDHAQNFMILALPAEKLAYALLMGVSET